jgi:hypothetical protein
LDVKEVAVSKLCCPACWEYFDILSEKHLTEGIYKIRGRHSTVYPVQLPSWSRPDVVQELKQRFGKYLRNELETMWKNHLWDNSLREIGSSRSGHAHKPSLQSVTSAITNASILSAESNINDESFKSGRLFGSSSKH